MKTYLEITLLSDGEKASAITSKLIENWFQPGIGQHDFVYEWKKDVLMPQLLHFIDHVQEKLKDSKILLKFQTI